MACLIIIAEFAAGKLTATSVAAIIIPAAPQNALRVIINDNRRLLTNTNAREEKTMPYVPSEKTVPPADDRKVIDAAVENLANRVATLIVKNSDLRREYKQVFFKVSNDLLHLLKTHSIHRGLEWNLAEAIYETGAKYGYEGAYLGEFNYAFTRFIQRVPQIKVEMGEWRDELRYWLYADTVAALIYASRHTEDLDIGVDGVFIDIKDEYKWRVNRPYETAQILKSGDCYNTPYYNKPVEVVDENGNHIGHVYVDLRRSEATLHKDLLDGQIVLRKKS